MKLVVLGVVIVSVLSWPLMKHEVIKAQYASEAMPALSCLQERIALFRFESGRLPGLGLPSGEVPGDTSQLAPDLSRVQTVAATTAAFAAAFGRKVDVVHTNHVLRQVGISPADLIGHRIRPQHVQYRADACETGRHVYGIGVFGDGERLMAGTGYAVLDVQIKEDDGRLSAVWERWSPVTKKVQQVVLVNAAEAKAFFGCETPEQARRMDLCWVGDPEALLSADAGIRDRAKAELRKAGWTIFGETPVPWYRKGSEVALAIPALLLYVLFLVMLGAGTFAKKPVNWRCRAGFILWLVMLAVTLPASPVEPLTWLIVGGIAFWIWIRFMKGIRWLVRRLRNRKNA